MAKEKKGATVGIDNVLNDLYNKAGEFTDKLAVAKEMVKLECARLKQGEDNSDIPDFYKDEGGK